MKKRDKVTLLVGNNTATIYASHPKTFLKLSKDFMFSECGVAFVDNDRTETLVKCDSSENAVETYKRVIDMIDLKEAERLKIGKNALIKLKEDAITYNHGTFASLVACGLLLGDNDPKYWTYLLTLLLASSVNVVEVGKIIWKLVSKPEDRAALETDLAELGVLTQARNCEKTDDVSLYLKLNDGLAKKK